MTEKAVFPSEAFPAFTRVSLDLPEGWEPLPLVEAPLAVARVTPPGEYRANVVVAIARYSNDVTIENLAEAVIATFESLDDVAETGREFRTVEGFDAFRIEGAYRNAKAGTVYNSVWIVRVERGPFIESVQLTGSCGGNQVDEVLLDLRRIQSGVEFG